MNALSWLPYVAEVSDRLGFVLIACAAVMALGSAIHTFNACLENDSASHRAGEPRAPQRWGQKALAVLIPAVLACTTPSSTTLYMIVASQTGEQVARSPEGQELLDLGRKKVREVLATKTSK